MRFTMSSLNGSVQKSQEELEDKIENMGEVLSKESKI
jgi:hypothetical protein